MRFSYVLVPAFLVVLAGCSSSSTSSSTTSATTTASGAGGGGTTTTTDAGGAGQGGAAGTGGAAASGDCTNDADKTIIEGDAAGLQTKVGDCGKNNLGNDGATHDCITKDTGLSDKCTDCFVKEVDCAAAKCLGPCLADSAGAECAACRAKNCDPAFEVCAGLSANPK